MNILHVISGLDPRLGGPPRVAVRLAAGQAYLGHSVTLASYVLTQHDEFRAMTRRLPAFDRVRIVELQPGGLAERLLASRSKPVLQSLVNSSDVVHIHNVWDSINCAAATAARRAVKPYIIQPNDMLNPYSLSVKRHKKRLALALRYRAMIENAHALLFGHSEERRLVQTVGFRVNHLTAALGGIFAQEVEPLPDPGRFYQRFPALQGKPFVVFLSRLHPKKGLDYLAEGFAVAARMVPEAHLVVIGHDEGAQADFEQRIGRHRLEHRVHLVGPQHGDGKWEAYRDAACFCLPSRDEAFTVAITEALAATLPVVISANCHFDDVREYQAGYIVNPESAQELGEALARLLADPALRDQMSRNAARLFRERLSFEQAAKDTLSIYEQAIQLPAKLALPTISH